MIAHSFRNCAVFGVVILLAVAGALVIAPANALTDGHIEVGMEVPDFSLRGMTGERKTFADLEGEKLTMIVFWASWSPRAEKELKRIETVYQKYKDKGFAVIGINVEGQDITDASMAGINAMVDGLKLSFPILIDHGLVSFHDYGVIAIPTTVILDSERTVKYALLGYPLMGAEEMFDYVEVAIEGKKPTVVKKAGYEADKKVVRLWNVGKSALRSKRMADTAEVWFKKAIEADPKFVAPHISLGYFYLKKGKGELAKKEFNEAISKEPENAAALCELGLMLVNEGKTEEGKALIEKGMKAREGYILGYYYLGYALAKEGKLEAGLKMFDEAEQLNPLDYNLYTYKARAYEDNKDPRMAADNYKKALELVLFQE